MFQQEVTDLVGEAQRIQTNVWQDIDYLRVEFPPYQKLDYNSTKVLHVGERDV
jgi:hypothetical protein